MFNRFNEEVKKIIALSKQELNKLHHPYLGSEHLMLAILKNDNKVSKILKQYNITYSLFKEKVINLIGLGEEKNGLILYTPIVKEIFERANTISDENNAEVTIETLFTSLIEIGEGIAYKILIDLKIDIDKLYNEFIFKIPKKLKKKRNIIDELGMDFTENYKTFDPVIGRDKEINNIIEILIRKNKSNPILIGEAGVGKTAIIEELSRRIALAKVPNQLKGKHIINIDMSSVVAGTKYRGEFEDKINKILKEVENNKDIILFIDEIHTLVGAGGAEGAIDASNIFKPALARNKLKCIGATTMEEYQKYIDKDKALARRFKKVIIEEPTITNTKNIIYGLKPIYEKYHHVTIKNNLLDLLIDLTNRYICNQKNPDKTIDMLDELCAHVNTKDNPKISEYNDLTNRLLLISKQKNDYIAQNKFKEALELKQQENEIISQMNELEFSLATTNYNIITKKDIEEVISNKIDIPLFSLKPKKIIKNINDKVVAQEEAVKRLVEGYFNNKETNKIYSILLTGKSGVGKTLLANTFAKQITNKVIYINMSEYTDKHMLSKLIGTPAGYIGYDDQKYIFNVIREYPFSVIILDEIDKCHPNILNLFEQILETSKVNDSKENTIYFNNVTIIMTTNIETNNYLGFNNKENSKLNEYFTHSFINKINDKIELNSLTESAIKAIVKKEFKEINKNKIIDIKTIDTIVSLSDYKINGAKNIKNEVIKWTKSKKNKKICKNYSKN